MRLAALMAVALCGCDVDLERMIDQPRIDSYERCRVCPDSTVMMQPPDGVVARAPRSEPSLERAVAGDRWVSDMPVKLSRSLLSRGRERFEIVCATCHGALGDGDSPVAEDMKLRSPRSLVEPPVSDYPPGRIYAVIDAGWGLMPSLGSMVAPRDRWAIIAYLEALERRVARLDELPPELRAEARRRLR